MLVSWTLLQPSARGRRWRHVGLAIGFAAALCLFAAAAVSAPFDAVLALLAGIACVATWAAAGRRGREPFEVGVSALGEVKLRERDRADDAAVSVSVAFASPWLITLRRGTMLIPIWPDSLPQSTFRQLWVHLRWGREMPGDDDRRAVATNRANSKDR